MEQDINTEIDIHYEKDTDQIECGKTILSENDPAQTEILKEFFKKLEFLQTQWEKSEAKYKLLLIENEKLTCLIEAERNKSAVCKKRLKFIQDNQKTFEKLRQVYLNIKYNEKTNAMIEVREQGIQTECELNTGEPDYNYINRCEIDKALGMVQSLKSLVQKRELNCAINQNRAYEMNSNVVQLQRENSMLRTYLQAKNLELNAIKSDEALVDQLIKENKTLRKLVIKFDRHLRVAEKTFKPVKYPELCDDENKFVDNLLDPYKLTTQNYAKTKPKNETVRMDKTKSDNVLFAKKHPESRAEKQSKNINSIDSAVKILENLRIVQPIYRTGEHTKKKKTFYPCDKLERAFSNVVRSSTFCSPKYNKSFL